MTPQDSTGEADAEILNAEIAYIVPEEGSYEARAHSNALNPEGFDAHVESLPSDYGKESKMRSCGFRVWPCILLLGMLIAGGIATFLIVKDKDTETVESRDEDDAWDLQEKLFQLEKELSVNASNPFDFLDRSSPQARALEWLSYEDNTLTSIGASNLLQRYAVIVFAYATNAELWRVEVPWIDMSSYHECSFEGISCDSKQQVVFIDLYDKRVSGTIPSELGLLTGLTSIVLSDNLIQGSIPESIYTKLTNLKILDLSSNRIASTISDEVGRLTNLQQFLFARTNLYGSLPESLRMLTNLDVMAVSSTDLNGPIFDFALSWPKLISLEFSFSSLTGIIPTEIASLTNLKYIISTGSHVAAPIPTEIGLLTDLERFDHETIRMDLLGTIPTEMGNLKQLDYLNVAGRGLTGTIPSEIGRLSNLVRLALYRSNILGTIPSEIGLLSNLEQLWFESNKLEGAVPSELGSLAGNLEQLSIGNNFLEGNMPIEFCGVAAELILDCDVECPCCIVKACFH